MTPTPNSSKRRRDVVLIVCGLVACAVVVLAVLTRPEVARSVLNRDATETDGGGPDSRASAPVHSTSVESDAPATRAASNLPARSIPAQMSVTIQVIDDVLQSNICEASISASLDQDCHAYVTDDRGIAVIPIPRPTVLRLDVRARKYAPKLVEATVGDPSTSHLVIRLMRASAIVVRVSDTSGAPVKDATVSCRPAYLMNTADPVAEAWTPTKTTDASGSAAFSDLSPLCYYVNAFGIGLGPSNVTACLRSGDESTVDVRLEPASILNIRLLDSETNEPVPGVPVDVTLERSGKHLLLGLLETDAMGVIAIQRTVGSSCRLRNAMASMCSFREVVVPPDTMEQTILIRRAHGLLCLVTEPDGAVVMQATIELYTEYGKRWSISSVAGPTGIHLVPDQTVMGSPRFRFIGKNGDSSAWLLCDGKVDPDYIARVVVLPVVDVRLRVIRQDNTPVIGSVLIAIPRRTIPTSSVGADASAAGTVRHGFVVASDSADEDGRLTLSLSRGSVYQLRLKCPGEGEREAVVWTDIESKAEHGFLGNPPFAFMSKEGDSIIDLGNVLVENAGSAVVRCVGMGSGERRRVLLRPVKNAVWSGVTLSDITDGYGEVTFENVSPGQYVISANHATPHVAQEWPNPHNTNIINVVAGGTVQGEVR